jgi:hypothetical protein
MQLSLKLPKWLGVYGSCKKVAEEDRNDENEMRRDREASRVTHCVQMNER